MNNRFPPPDWFMRSETWAPWMPNAASNGAPISPATAPIPPAPPASTSNQDHSLPFERGSFNWVETPNGGLLAVHPNGNDIEWVETPSGGLLAYPKRQVNPSWALRAMPFGPNVENPATPALPSPPPSSMPPAPPTSAGNRAESSWNELRGVNWMETPNGGLLPVHRNSGDVNWVETPSGGLLAHPKQEVNLPWARRAMPEHLDSMYWGGAPSPASTEPLPGSGQHLSSMTHAPSWEVPTRATTDAAQIFAKSPSPSSSSASRIPAQGHFVEETAEELPAPTEHAVAQKQFVEPSSDPHRDFAQAAPFGGFDSPSPVESLANQSEFYECMRSRTSSSSEMKRGYYEFCTYGRLAMTKQDPNTGEPTELLFTPGPNGNEVYGRDHITGAWGRWTLSPGQSLIATLDEDGKFHMNIR